MKARVSTPLVLLALVLASSPAGAQVPVDTLDVPVPGLHSFGGRIEVQGEWAAVRAWDSGLGDGRLFLFRRDATGWNSWGEVQPPDLPGQPYLNFAGDFDLDGDALAVAIPGYRLASSGVPEGGVLTYRWDGQAWSYEALLQEPFTEQFGQVLELEGDLLVVSHAATNARVTTYVWDQQWELHTEGEQPHGGPAALWGQTMVAAGPWEPTRVFRFEGNQWVGGQALAAGIISDYQGFVGDGDRILGVTFEVQPANGAYVWHDGSQGWQVEGSVLRVPGLDAADGFGSQFDFQGDLAVFSAPYQNEQRGAFYTFHREGQGWRPTGHFPNPTGIPVSRFGRDIALEAGQVFVGSVGDIGAEQLPVLVYDMNPNVVPYRTCLGPLAPCDNADVTAGCENSTGAGALLRALGGTSVSADDLTLRMESLPTQQFALVYMGGAAASLPFGDGLRAVAPGDGGLYRFPIGQANGSGRLEYGPGLAAFSQANFGNGAIQAGSSWYFQGWYRDPQGPCGTGFNLTPGLRVRFSL